MLAYLLFNSSKFIIRSLHLGSGIGDTPNPEKKYGAMRLLEMNEVGRRIRASFCNSLALHAMLQTLSRQKGFTYRMVSIKGNKEARRAELLRVAREVFAEKGFEAATISEIVARAGVAQGTFYWYFPSKISLVMDLSKQMQAQIEEALSQAYVEANSPGEMIDKSVASAFHIMGNFRDILAILHSDACWTKDTSEHSRLFTPYYGLIAEAIRKEQQRGRIDSSIDPEVTAVLIVGTIYYAADECYIFNSPIPLESYIVQCAGYIRRALGIVH